jgi:hypothetical protein
MLQTTCGDTDARQVVLNFVSDKVLCRPKSD